MEVYTNINLVNSFPSTLVSVPTFHRGVFPKPKDITRLILLSLCCLRLLFNLVRQSMLLKCKHR